jgi:hypothetical protein
MAEIFMMIFNFAICFLLFLTVIAVAITMFIGMFVLPIGFIVCKAMGTDLDKVLVFTWNEFRGKKNEPEQKVSERHSSSLDEWD